MTVTENQAGPPWLLLVFSLPAKRASERVTVWRKLQRYGALALRSAGYLLPNMPENQERFQWLAAAIRKYRGQASVAQVQAMDDLPSEEIVKLFLEARGRDYEALDREIKRLLARRERPVAKLSRVRRRFQEVSSIDFFSSPLRSRVEARLAKLDTGAAVPARLRANAGAREQFCKRVWITRPRPGIDRVSSAWLIRRWIDPNGRFVFGNDARDFPDAIPFDMFGEAGFGHRGEDCTFETLCKEFAIGDRRATILAQIIHDADLGDEKFGRSEGLGLDRALIGWAQQGVSDDELLRRGMELIEGLYQAVS